MKTKKLNKNMGVIALILLLFIGTVYLNITSNGDKTAENASAPKNTTAPAGGSLDEELENAQEAQNSTAAGTSYFTAFRDTRESRRNREIAYLDAIISNTSTDAETLAEAQAQKLEMVKLMEAEFTIESLIVAKGFNDAAVTYHNGSINVIIDAQSLTSAQVAQILDIVMTETGEPATSVKVSVKQ